MTIQSYISPTFFDARIQAINTALAGLSIVDRYPLCQVGISDGETFPECYRNDGTRISERIYPEGTCLSFFLLNGEITTIEDDYDFNVPLSLFVWADLSKISNTASQLIQEVAKRLKSNSCNDLTIQTENVFSDFLDLEKKRFQNVQYPYFAFRIDFYVMATICVNQQTGVILPPVLVSIILTATNTIELTYDKALNESIIPALTDHIFDYSGDIFRITEDGNLRITEDGNYRETEESETPIPLLDLDGNEYTTLVIGTREWIIENLRVTKYSDGSAIPNLTDDTDWINDLTGAYCWHSNDIANKAIYGALYNWRAAVNVKNIAYLEKNGVQEVGWRVPLLADFESIRTIHGTTDLGGKLKESGLTNWITPNTGATNEIGFTWVPGSERQDNIFQDLGYAGYLWTSQELGTFTAKGYAVVYNNSNLALFSDQKRFGFSIRLVRDI